MGPGPKILLLSLDHISDTPQALSLNERDTSLGHLSLSLPQLGHHLFIHQ